MINRSKAHFLDFVSPLGVRWTQRPCPGNLLWLALFKAPPPPPPGILLFIGPFGLQRPRFGILLRNIFTWGLIAFLQTFVSDACRIASSVIVFALTSSDFYPLVFIFYLLLNVLISVIRSVYSVFFVSLILLFCRLLFSTTFLLSCTFW